MVQTLRSIHQKCGRSHHISETTLRNIVHKFYQTESVLNVLKATRVRNARSAENIAAVSESIVESPKMSVHHRSQHSRLEF